jgi:UDP-2-acetamido-3-amino-2,3-dideoxy-glucuronate N-acetyltransferase
MRSSFYAHETAVVDPGCIVGDNTKIWHFSHLMTGCEIGERCNIGQNVFIASGVRLGDKVKVQNNVSIYTGVICEDDVFLGPSMVFTNVINPRSAVIRKDQFESTLVKRGASIGANATIVCGVTIGEFAFVGAGAVVVRDVKPFSIVVGNPAKTIGWISEFGHRLEFNEEGVAVCLESKQEYRLEHENVKRVR